MYKAHPIGQVAIGVQSPLQTQLLQQGLIGAGQQLVEDVEVALAAHLGHHAGLLQEVVQDIAADRSALEVKLDVHVLAEARGVVVAVRLGIAEGLQHGIALQQLVLDALDGGLIARAGGNELKDLLGGLRLAGTTLARDEHALATVLLDQRTEGIVRHRKAGGDFT